MHAKLEVLQTQARAVQLLQCLALQLMKNMRAAKAIPAVREVVQGLPGKGKACPT